MLYRYKDERLDLTVRVKEEWISFHSLYWRCTVIKVHSRSAGNLDWEKGDIAILLKTNMSPIPDPNTLLKEII